MCAPPPQTHLPGFVAEAKELQGRGVDLVACLAVNDVFVVSEWGKALGTQGKVRGPQGMMEG